MCLKILVGSSWDLNLLPLRGGGGTVHAVQEVGGGGGGGGFCITLQECEFLANLPTSLPVAISSS